MPAHYVKRYDLSKYTLKSFDSSNEFGCDTSNNDNITINKNGTKVVLGDLQIGQSSTSGYGDAVLDSFVSTTGVANTSTTETTLRTYNIPAKAFNATTGTTVQRIIGTAWGSTAANANTKTIRLKVGSSITVTCNPTTTAPNNKTWFLDYEIVRTGASTQAVYATLSFNGTAAESVSFNTSGTETDTSAIAVVISGQSGTASNDILLNSHQATFAG